MGQLFRDLSVLLPYLFRQDQFPVPVELVQPVVLPRLICPAKPVPSSLRRQIAFLPSALIEHQSGLPQTWQGESVATECQTVLLIADHPNLLRNASMNRPVQDECARFDRSSRL